jgi:hypothetical protein
MESELINYVKQGGSLCIFPNDNIDLGSYNDLLQTFASVSIGPKINSVAKVNQLYKEHPIYQDIFDEIPNNVDLPFVNSYYPLSTTPTSGSEVLMRFQNGNPFLTMISNGTGNVTFCASPLSNDASNFTKHALFVPTMLRLAEFSGYRNNYWYVVGKDNSISTSEQLKTSDKIEVKYLESENSFLPELKITKSETSLLLYNQVTDAGHYNILVNEMPIFGVSFNFDRNESVQDFMTTEDLTNVINTTDIGQHMKVLENADSSNGVAIQDIVKGKKYWWHLIVIALILLGLEILVFRLF